MKPGFGSQFRAPVRDLTLKGLGVVDHPEGRVFFVPGVWPGDEGEFAVESESKTYGFARLVQLMTPSKERRSDRPCPYQGEGEGFCGGCPWMLATDEAQLKAKERLLLAQLQRQSLLPGQDFELKAIWPSPQTLGYRNRAQFKTDGKRLGFISRDSHQLVEIEDCVVLTPKNRRSLQHLRSQLPNSHWRPRPGMHWSYLDIDEELEPEQVEVNRRRPFRQGNTEQNQRMQAWLQEQLEGVSRQAPVLELFAGSGNFTQVISQMGFEKVWAVEGRGEALESLRVQKLNGVVSREMNLLEKSAVPQLQQSFGGSQVLVLDPPREGMPQLAQLVRGLPALEHIFYISCEVGGWARDAARLREVGFALEQVQPLDQFPQTPYLEILSKFKRLSIEGRRL